MMIHDDKGLECGSGFWLVLGGGSGERGALRKESSLALVLHAHQVLACSLHCWVRGS